MIKGSPKYTPKSYISLTPRNNDSSRRDRLRFKTKVLVGETPRKRRKQDPYLCSDSGEYVNAPWKNEYVEGPCTDEYIEAPPWKIKPSYSRGIIGLHEEINDFYEMMCPKEQEMDIRSKVVDHITRIVHSLWPQAKVESFGSFKTGLYLPTSDIDLVVFGKWGYLPLNTLTEALRSSGINYGDVMTVPSAKVPIIRLNHTPSSVKVDISFNLPSGVKSGIIIKDMMSKYPALAKLVLVLKQFLRHRGLNEVYSGGMSSYCLTLLVISFLQGYHKPKCDPSSNLGTLLIEFFELYGINFNYEKVGISFSNGGCYQPRYDFNDHMLQIEDPLVEGSDIAKGTFLMSHLKRAFENAYRVLHRAVTGCVASNSSQSSFLRLILDIDEDILQKRDWIRQNYFNIVQSFMAPCSDSPFRSVNKSPMRSVNKSPMRSVNKSPLKTVNKIHKKKKEEKTQPKKKRRRPKKKPLRSRQLTLIPTH